MNVEQVFWFLIFENAMRNDGRSHRFTMGQQARARSLIMIYALTVILILIGGAAGSGVLIIAGMDPEINPREATNRFPKR